MPRRCFVPLAVGGAFVALVQNSEQWINADPSNQESINGRTTRPVLYLFLSPNHLVALHGMRLQRVSGVSSDLTRDDEVGHVLHQSVQLCSATSIVFRSHGVT
jgi:hypothetical protein